MNKKTGHVSLAFKQIRENVKSLGFTHSGDEKNFSKTKLIHNINPNDNRPCYVKNDIEEYNFRDYKSSKKFNDYRIHKDDEKCIKNIISKKKR